MNFVATPVERIRALLHDNSAVSTTEYAVLLACIVLGTMVAIKYFGSTFQTFFNVNVGKYLSS